MSIAVLMPGCGTVKTKKLAGSRGEISGYCVRFTTPSEVDCVRDFFDARSELGIQYLKSLPLMLDHGRGETGQRILGDLSFRKDAKGLHVRGSLDLSDPILAKIFEGAMSGILGWSTSSLSQFIERVAVKVADKETVYWLKRWHVGEASLTAKACDTRTSAAATLPLKSFKPVPLADLLEMTPGERFLWEKNRTAAHLQRALDDGAELSPEIRQRFGLLGNDWLRNQAELHSQNPAERNCGCHQTKVAGLESTPANRYELARVARVAGMRIPQR